MPSWSSVNDATGGWLGVFAITLLVGGTFPLIIGLIADTWENYHSPLQKFPGPTAAGISGWWKTWKELFGGRSWTLVLEDLHKKYGDVVRVAPNEAYNDLYNNTKRWDKEESLYHSFGEDQSSFGYLTYTEAKKRKDVMAPLFSKRAITDVQFLVRDNIDKLCDALAKNNQAGKSSDMLYGLRCFTSDTIVQFAFAKNLGSLDAPDFKAPIVVAMDAALGSFVVFKNFDLLRKVVYSLPGWLTKITSPPLAGLVDLQMILGAQVKEVARNPQALNEAPHPIIYTRLLDKKANKDGGIPTEDSLYEEAQALLFGGADSAGNTATFGFFYVVSNPKIYKKLKEELRKAWPSLGKAPKYEDLEKLPYLTAVIQESLRMAPGVPAPLLRVVPDAGAKIGLYTVPGKTVVGMAAQFVHRSPEIFTEPDKFNPDRWLQADSKDLDKWLIAFSRGPRMCLGQNLAMCELYLAFAHLFRRFDFELDGSKEEDLAWTERFLPLFTGRHIRAFCKPVAS